MKWSVARLQIALRRRWVKADPTNILRRLQAENAYLVAGIGRCGTTLVYRAIRLSGRCDRIFRFVDRCADRDSWPRGCAFKTHDRPPAQLPAHLKVLFLFGNPMNAALSAYSEFRPGGLGHDHYRQVGSPHGARHEQIFTEDLLGMEAHFNAWYRPQAFDLLTLRYEALYEGPVRAALDDFLGFEVELPPQRPRNTVWSRHPRREELQGTYGKLAQQIDSADDVRFWPRGGEYRT